MTAQLNQYADLMRFDKPIGTLLLLWPTLWALWIAGNGHPDKFIVLIFVAGTFLTRSAGVVINDVIDRKFDGAVSRTAQRPLAKGTLNSQQALILAALLGLLACALLIFLNPLTRLLAIIGGLLAIFYPFCKRFTYLPQCVLGVAFGWSVPMAFAAQTGAIPPLGWYLFTVAALWPVAYDTFYAMVDREDDRQLGLKSTALLLGRYDRLCIGILQTLILSMLLLLGWQLSLTRPYYICLSLAAGLAMYTQWLTRDRLPAQCFKAFLSNNWFGLIIFVGIYLGIG